MSDPEFSLSKIDFVSAGSIPTSGTRKSKGLQLEKAQSLFN